LKGPVRYSGFHIPRLAARGIPERFLRYAVNQRGGGGQIITVLPSNRPVDLEQHISALPSDWGILPSGYFTSTLRLSSVPQPPTRFPAPSTWIPTFYTARLTLKRQSLSSSQEEYQWGTLPLMVTINTTLSNVPRSSTRFPNTVDTINYGSYVRARSYCGSPSYERFP